MENNFENVVYLKNWFFKKNYAGDYANHFGLVIKETEKAYQIVLTLGVDACDVKTWVPKSCTIRTKEDLDAEIALAAEWEAKRQAKYEEACKAYQELVAYAQKMGVKGVREGLRKDTIIAKMEKAGVALPA